jgi:hypothetical protein
MPHGQAEIILSPRTVLGGARLWRPGIRRDFFFKKGIAMRQRATWEIYIVAFCFVSVLVCSCGTAYVRPTPEQLRDADYGPQPSNYEEMVKNRLVPALAQYGPSSAMYRFSSPKQGWYSDGQTIYYGWAVCGRASTTHYSGPYAEGHPFFCADTKREGCSATDGIRCSSVL